MVTSSYPATAADVAGAFIPGFASALSAKGCAVTVLTPDKVGRKDQPADYSVRWFEWAGSPKPIVDLNVRSLTDLRLILSLLRDGERALRRLIDEERIEACLALWAVPAGYLARRACRKRIPYSVWALGSDIHVWARRPFAGRLVRAVLKDADQRFADGIELAAEVRRISGRDCLFLPSTRRLPAPARLPEPLGPGVNFLFVGRLEPVKGPDVMVEAFLRVLESGVEARLTMCGAGSMKEALQQRVQAAGAADRVRFLGGVPGDVIAALMGVCDCLVVASRNESIPVVFSEALQAGIPILVTDVGDLGDLARKHGLASPVAPGDPAALAAAMEGFARDPAGHRQGYESARSELLKMFDLPSIAGRYLDSIGG